MELQKTDPEFMERFRHFAFDEVVKEENQQLDAPTRYLAILAALIGCGGVDAFREMLPAALKNGVTPVMVKETVYQAADYLGHISSAVEPAHNDSRDNQIRPAKRNAAGLQQLRQSIGHNQGLYNQWCAADNFNI